jgi:hypothetical protein
MSGPSRKDTKFRWVDQARMFLDFKARGDFEAALTHYMLFKRPDKLKRAIDKEMRAH